MSDECPCDGCTCPCDGCTGPRPVRRLCCDGTGTVPDVDDAPRPCSRCRYDDSRIWADARRPKRLAVVPVED